jgi:hypothetical protein
VPERIRYPALKTFATHGAKINLVQAADDHVTAVPTSSPVAAAPTADPVADIADRVVSPLADQVEVVDHLCRQGLVDAAPTGTRVFDTAVTVAGGRWDELQEQGLTKPNLGPIWMTLNPLVLVLGMFILRPQLSRHLPKALATQTQSQRWRNATEAIIAAGQLKRPELPDD